MAIVCHNPRMPMRRLAEERSKLFDQQAECYDRCRPTYPSAVIAELLSPEPAGLDVLDVGCGTGIASRRRGKIAPCLPADPSSGALVGHCHDRN